MAILVDQNIRLICQGFTGEHGTFHTLRCAEYGTTVVGGVVPGKGGKIHAGYPVFDTVEEAKEQGGANTSMIFVPAPYCKDALIEAIDAKMDLIVCITEGIPVADMVFVKRYLAGKHTRLIGPNCPGVISPGMAKVGIMPGNIHRSGPIGVVSRSGTLTYEAVHTLTLCGLGQSTCIGIGGDPITGMNFVDVLRLFQDDPQTEAVLLIGEIGGTMEEEAAQWVGEHMTKPVAAFIAGATAPKGKRMGHAGAIIAGGKGTYEQKAATLRAHGIALAQSPETMGDVVKDLLG